MRILGVDFTSRPNRRKPITVALGVLDGATVAMRDVVRCDDFASFDAMLATPGPWVGGFDFPFSLSRELVVAMGWPLDWRSLIAHYASLERADVAARFDAFRAARPVGGKYAHRATERAAGAHAAMKLVNPPVAWMLREGVTRLVAAGLHLPGLHEGDRGRVAVEAYPGMLMRGIAQRWGLRRTPSYKNDAPGLRTPAQRETRVRLLWSLVEGEHPLGLQLDVPVGLAAAAVDDGTGDTLDALAAAVQAAWCAARAEAGFGMPADADPLEGWIATTGAGTPAAVQAPSVPSSRGPAAPPASGAVRPASRDRRAGAGRKR